MGFRSGLFIYIYRQFFRGLPGDLEDAARIDGSSAFHSFFKIMLPNATPAIVTVFMLSLVWNWNDSFSQSFLSMSRNTVAVYLTQIRSMISAIGVQNEDPTYLYILIQSGALLCVVPLLLLFAFGQRFFTESVERTGIVG
jgi:multiple sugar transport system permease protein